MHSYTNRIAALILLTATSLYAARTPVPGDLTKGLESPVDLATKAVPLIWQDDLDTALGLAAVEYKPVLVLFSSPSCSWCRRLKREVMSTPEIRALLPHYTLVEIDVTVSPRTASLYQVSGVPAVLIMSPDGRPRSGVNGFIPATEMETLLREGLNPNVVPPKDEGFRALASMLATNGVPNDRWADVALALGRKDKRREVRDLVFALDPLPREALVPLLADPRLAVRLGALELLEELSGESLGYDPWAGAGDTNALATWWAWARNTNVTARAVFTALDAQQVEAYLTDLISDDRRRSLRALQMLETGGPGVITIITHFLESHPDLPTGARMKVLEAQYLLQIPAGPGVDPSQLAHRLIFGTLDVRLKSIARLASVGKPAIPLLVDFLGSQDAIVRETAVDALVTLGGSAVVTLLADHLKEEQDADVVYSVLRGLGDIKSKQGLGLLASYLSDPNEELVIVALDSIARLKSRTAEQGIKAGLTDPRWRVRAATLDAIAKLKLKSLGADIEPLLADEDDFVRYAAVKALAGVAATGAKDKLVGAFQTDDALKAPVVAALCSMDVALPSSFGEHLDGCGPETLLAVLDAMDDCESHDLWLAKPLAQHANLDVACAATRLMAAKGSGMSVYQALLTDILSTGPREAALAALEAYTLDSNTRKQFQSMFPQWFVMSTGPAMPAASHQALNDLFSAFDDAPASSASPPAPPVKTVALSELFDAFGGDDESAGTVATSGQEDTSGGTSGSFQGIMDAMKLLMGRDDDPEIQFAAALALGRLGSPDAVDPLGMDLTQRTVAERTAVARAIAGVRSDDVFPILKALLNDPAQAVRAAAVEASLEQGAKDAAIDAIFEQLLQPDSRLRPHEAYGYRLESAAERGSHSRKIHQWAVRLLDESLDPEMKILALVLLEKGWKRGDEKYVEPLIVSESPLVRRAAYHATGKGSRTAFLPHVKAVTEDTSERVRAVLPNVYMRDSAQWMHYFSDKHYDRDHTYWSSFQSGSRRLKPEVAAALRTLTADPSPQIRMEAFFCLLSNRQSFEMAPFIATLDTLPDRRSAAERVAAYMTEHYKKLGPGFKALLPYVEASDAEPDDVRKVQKHFGKHDGANTAATLTYEDRKVSDRDLRATFVEGGPEPTTTTNGPLSLVYFRSPGCGDCERVDGLLTQLAAYLPDLQVETFNIRKIKAMRLNEALCGRFKVPDTLRLVAPAIFLQSGYLVKGDITFSGLGQLAATAKRGGEVDWHRVEDDDLAAAETAIDTRYTRMGLGLVGLAGLIDGVNPCAFATIIFLLSYLQVTKRRPGQILAVGLAFVAGVFLAYFLLGIGLVEVVSRLTALKIASRIVNVVIAIFAFVVMVLSLRDGILCLQGRLSDMTLQLPAVLKTRIHGVIRRGSRQTHFIAAAFGVGVAISVLELACTGQVYAPTILFMLKTGRNTAGALSYLVFYNLAFVTPLIIIFILATLGLRSDGLTHFMHRHAALVKFCTAGLFFVLFLLFLFGDRLQALMQM